jgi:hypothetical protein
LFKRVVFPAPRNPVRMVTPILFMIAIVIWNRRGEASYIACGGWQKLSLNDTFKSPHLSGICQSLKLTFEEKNIVHQVLRLLLQYKVVEHIDITHSFK